MGNENKKSTKNIDTDNENMKKYDKEKKMCVLQRRNSRKS